MISTHRASSMKNVTFGVGIRNQKSLFVSLTKFPKARALLTLHSKSEHMLEGNVLSSTRQLKPNGQCTLCRLGARVGRTSWQQVCARSPALSLSLSLGRLNSLLSEWRLGAAAFVCHKNGALSSLAKLDVLLEI